MPYFSIVVSPLRYAGTTNRRQLSLSACAGQFRSAASIPARLPVSVDQGWLQIESKETIPGTNQDTKSILNQHYTGREVAPPRNLIHSTEWISA